MSTNTLLKVEGTAWAHSRSIEDEIKKLRTSVEIIEALGLDWTASAHNVKTDIEEPVAGYYGMYRDDTSQFLGIVKSDNPVVTQNVDMFKSLEPLMDEGTLVPVVADSYLGGKQVFGTFKFNQDFEVLGDTFNHYFIVVNNHLKPDGNIQIINTPVRLACMNTMSYALSRSGLKFRIPAVVEDATIISNSIMNAFERTANTMKKSAESLVSMKISRDGIDKLLDELFPYVEEPEGHTTSHDRANQTIDMQREAFITCLNADNLANYQGTAWQVFNALTDYASHYHRNADKAMDLSYRMNLVPGMNPEATTEMLKVSKFVNNLSLFAQAA